MGSLIRSAQLIGVITLAACAGRSATREASPDSQAMLRVENQSFADMVIYAVNGGQRIRLGLATGNTTKTFAIPRYLVHAGGRMRFLADPVGGTRTPVSEEMTVEPGDLVSLTIPPQP